MNTPALTPFILPGEPLTMNTPFKAMHIWHWLNLINPASVTLAGYLEALGFIKGQHSLTQLEREVLRSTLNHWAWMRHKGYSTAV